MRCSFLAACLFAAFSLCIVILPVQAAPAAPIEFLLTQPDGSRFSARQWGDEHSSGFETLDGYTILRDADGTWVYAEWTDGVLAPARRSGQRLVVGIAMPLGLERAARPAPARDAVLPGLNGPAEGQPAGLLAPALGNQPLLVVLARFADTPFQYTRSSWRSRAFGDSGSIRAYYSDASYGALQLTPAREQNGTANDGIVEVVLPYNHPNTRTTSQGAQIIRDALAAADLTVDFAAYDTSGNGLVSSNELHILVIAAGYEAAYYNEGTPALWAHMAGLYGMTFDGITIQRTDAPGDYGVAAIAGERHGDHQATIGVLVHELGHTLTFPDLYDPDGSSAGVGDWSLMGGGTWNAASRLGDSPAQPDAFLKWYAGWVQPMPASAGQRISLPSSHLRPGILLLGSNPSGVDWQFTRRAGTGEYWLVENRSEAGLPGCGILIWHINETADPANPNAIESNPLVALEQADGQNGLFVPTNRGDAGDPYPGLSGNSGFHDTSSPSSRYYSGSESGLSIWVANQQCGGQMEVVTAPAAVTLPGIQIFLPHLLR